MFCLRTCVWCECAADTMLLCSLFLRVVRGVSQDGSTPLFKASSKGHLKVVERLIAAQAMVDTAYKVAPRTRHTTLLPIHTSQHGEAGVGGWGEYSELGRVFCLAFVSLPSPLLSPRTCLYSFLSRHTASRQRMFFAASFPRS